MTELQKTEFELLKQFVEICNRLELTYFLVCGSALGTVKYGGFIPWDDDIDVAMPRQSYKTFCQNAPQMLKTGYFLQNYISDSSFPAIYSKLRDSETTYIEKSSEKLDINHGVYIDIFPLDGYPRKLSAQRRLEAKKRIYSHQLSAAFELPRSRASQWLYVFLCILGYRKRTRKVAIRYSKMISSFSIDASDLWCNHGNWQGKLEYAPKEQYGEGAWATFEGLKVRIPEKYDEYLTQKYGDWRADLPKEQQVGHHYYTVCDLNKPYTEYLK